ncbi:MAG TPA: NrfD/PsrC family molybdoenzyme membrane anchor subunit [Blastocatellia bacterium]|jgi:molybdopterin-containing oxidoreductase family membrane subunit|nr:NrfD/PsrC family molybdoenzyme membrane anchor subunit [Blastocatellia bacterium]
MRSDKETTINSELLQPLFKARRGWYVTVALSGAILLAAIYAFGYQIYKGIGVWGLNRPVFWAFDITNFVFWIGISHAGTLISAILRVTGAEWRRPVTRCAEAITVFALMVGAMFPIVHLGRPWLFYWLAPYPNERGLWPNYRSPLLWDFFAINTYLLGSLIYLYLPLIPDLALVRDKSTGLRRRIYSKLSLNWRGTQRQWSRLEKAVQVMAVIIIPVAVSVHTIVSWDFAMTIQPMWRSTIFGPYFVAGAIFSGIAALIIAMSIIRRVFHLEEYLKPIHFNNLGLLLLTMSLLWFYFTFAEYLTAWYGNEPIEKAVFQSKVSGAYSPLFWAMVVCCFIVPAPILAIKRLRTVTGTVVASVGVVVGMWLERFLIIVPTLAQPRLTFNWGSYRPTFIEIVLTAGTFAYFVLLYSVFTKLFPIIAVWEYKEGLGPHAEHGETVGAGEAAAAQGD